MFCNPLANTYDSLLTKREKPSFTLPESKKEFQNLNRNLVILTYTLL